LEFERDVPAERDVPDAVLDRLDNLLSADGFRQTLRGVYVRNLDKDWRAWIAVSGLPNLLLPNIGIYNEDVATIGRTAFAKVGRPNGNPPDTGPPLIMVGIERVIGDDADCAQHMSWSHQNKKNATLEQLGTDAADDLYYCLKKKGYPFFADRMTFESILAAGHNATASPAFPHYFPVVLVKLGRRDDVPRYVQDYLRRIPYPELQQNYKGYVDALMEVMGT
jgi:hypothetical protein